MRYIVPVLTALTLISYPCQAEVIDGPANVREAPSGITLFSLEDGIRVQHRKSDGRWFEIAVAVRIDPRTDFADTEMSVIKKGVTLYEENGKKIGATLSNVRTWPGEEVGNETQITVLIGGYTHQQNVRPDSILESNLAVLLEANKHVSQNVFSAHLADLQYEPWIDRDGFTSYINFNKPNNDPSPWPRAILFFYENTLIAVYHERVIASNRVAPSVNIRGGTMSYVTDVPIALRNKFSDIYYQIIENAD